MQVKDALLDSSDGLVLTGKRIWFHFQRFPWDLDQKENNPFHGEQYRQVTRRLARKLPDACNAQVLKGEFHLGIAPHMLSYYHLITDLLPHLIMQHRFPVLVPEWLSSRFRSFLKECGFALRVLPPGDYRVERLHIPAMPDEDWNTAKVPAVRDFVRKRFNLRSFRRSEKKRVYISRRRARRRHLVNEDTLLPLFEERGYQTMLLEKWSVRRQIDLFSNVTHLVAPHGAGLINAVFSPPEARILEIRPVVSSGDYCFDSLFGCGWSRHEVLVPRKRGRFEVSPDLLKRVLDRWEDTASMNGIE